MFANCITARKNKAQSERGMRSEYTISPQQEKGRAIPATDWVTSGSLTGGTRVVCSVLSQPEEQRQNDRPDSVCKTDESRSNTNLTYLTPLPTTFFKHEQEIAW